MYKESSWVGGSHERMPLAGEIGDVHKAISTFSYYVLTFSLLVLPCILPFMGNGKHFIADCFPTELKRTRHVFLNVEGVLLTYQPSNRHTCPGTANAARCQGGRQARQV
jgi:hypothetical protein